MGAREASSYETTIGGTWGVPSQTTPGLVYLVRIYEGWWSCTCPHWQYRLRETQGLCKHILKAAEGSP